ncbi:unnamed protein product [Blepharisma stoltei]|uniref:RING-type domain-containing protein n=1 Tax=Blepharisma stoltei TaxID=1481888 RepID=A0AAU9K128_9CILI|nr:unnamed protein product [Blepharisma stoltei]
MLNAHMSAGLTAQLPKIKRRGTVKRYINANIDKLLSRLSLESDEMEVAEDSRLNPCIICFSNRGQLSYTSCCSQPMHQECRLSTVISCPHCRSAEFKLQEFPFNPNRAFR